MTVGGNDTTMTYIGIALNLIGIALQLNPYYQSAWLALACVFFGGGFFFLGLFGRRQASGGRSLLDRLDPAMFNALAFMAVIMGIFFLANIGTAIYNIVQREMDIQAAKAGISTPSASPTPEISEH
jgi:hypothetical protein